MQVFSTSFLKVLLETARKSSLDMKILFSVANYERYPCIVSDHEPTN